MAGVGADVDVPADALRASKAGTTEASGAAAARSLSAVGVGGGALVGQRVEIDRRDQRIVHGRRDRHRGGRGRQMARARGQTDERDRQQQSLHA